ncbi:hypothetical protein B7486_70005 [cyanobacterium TDX16]|nr:hypothetical protein B7486_70005 [cyanobacterium TDX16]
MITWAYIYEHPGADPGRDRSELERDGQRSLMVPVAAAADAARVAAALVADEQVQLVELCGGFDLESVTRVVAAVGHQVPVGHVTFSVEALPAAAAFNGATEAATS